MRRATGQNRQVVADKSNTKKDGARINLPASSETASSKTPSSKTASSETLPVRRAIGFYPVIYAVFIVAAVVAVVEGADQDEWIALVTNGALAVTAFYAYKEARVDLAFIATFTVCTSVVWHSSAKFKDLDGFASRYMAYYAFGTTAFPPIAIGPAMLVVALLMTYEAHVNELYVFIPLVALLVVYKWLGGNRTCGCWPPSAWASAPWCATICPTGTGNVPALSPSR